VALGRRLGEPLLHPFLTAIDDHPEILRVIKEPEEFETFGGEYWHADITFMNPPASISLLQSLELPPTGGDTMFSNQYLLLEALDAETRAEIEGLNGVHLYPGHSTT
jgi:taurine dioxygenase